MGEKKINVDVFKKFKQFATEDELNRMFVNKKGIISSLSDVKILKYNESPFEEEFGIPDLGNFMSVISFYDNVEIKFDMPYIIFKDADSDSFFRYRAKKKKAYHNIVKGNEKAFFVMDSVKKNIDNKEKMFKFRIDSKKLKKFSQASSIMSANSRKSTKIRLIKNEEVSDDEILVRVHNEDSENEYVETITGKNYGVTEFNQCFDIDKLIPGTWDYYVWSREIEISDRTVDPVFVYMENVDDSKMSMLIMFSYEKLKL